MKTELCSYGGWARNLRLANDSTEVIISLDVGPRIISYRRLDGPNVLKNYPEEIGQANEDAFMIRGGHRLWIAPEDEQVSYHWDNQPVEYREEEDGTFVFYSRQSEPLKIDKELRVSLASEGSRLKVGHTARNAGDEPIRIATWGLTVMETEGLALVPMGALGSHPEDLLPNRNLILWPYTDLTDPRLHFGRNYILLRQSPSLGPIKFGLGVRAGWAGYLCGEDLFIKTFPFEHGAEYPDFGCNFETFTNESMIEIESLGALRDLGPGEEARHDEEWSLFGLAEPVELDTEEKITEWLQPYLGAAGVADS